MKKIIAIASGKGGVGKSTICCHLGKALADKIEKTVLVETDAGLRGLDIFLNVEEIIYDLGDYIEKNCSLEETIHKTKYNDNLFLIPAPFNFNINLKYNQLENLCEELKKNFDNIIFDLKAGIEIALEIKDLVDLFLIVVTPDTVCVRDAALFTKFLKIGEKNTTKYRLIINKIKKNFKKSSPFKTLDDIIDETKLQLIGVLPFEKEVEIKTQLGKDLKFNTIPFKIFKAIANRTNNEYEKLIIRSGFKI